MKPGDKIRHKVLKCLAAVVRVAGPVVWYDLYGSRSTIDDQNRKYWEVVS